MLYKFLCHRLLKNWNWYLGGSFIFFNISINDPEEREYEYSLPMILISLTCWNVKSTGIHFKILLSVWMCRMWQIIGEGVSSHYWGNNWNCNYTRIQFEGTNLTLFIPLAPDNYKVFFFFSKSLITISLNYWSNMVI